MKRQFSFLLFCLALPFCGFAQFGAEYSGYGFNFVNDAYNNGLRGWQGTHIGNPAKLSIYRQDPNKNNYALKFSAQNDSVKISYNDSGYMDLNPCSFVVNLRLKIPQFTGNQEGFTFKLNTGSKLVAIYLSNTGIYFLNNNRVYTYIAATPTPNIFKTYTISLDNCTLSGTLMIENDGSNMLPLSLPDDVSPQSIEMSANTAGNSVFETEIDHLMIYSKPKKWWLGAATPYINETNYAGTTGDRQHYLNLPNGQRIGVNENAGGYIPYLQMYPGGPNIDPNPKFGSGSTKTLRNYFQSADYNPVQAGTSSTTGGHLATVTSRQGQVKTAAFPLHLYYKSGITEHNLLTFPNGTTMAEFDNSATGDDVYDEFGIDMRNEIMTELDFETTIDDISRTGGISVVRHRAEWSYIRHPCQILQYHEPNTNYRFSLNGTSLSDADMGAMRHKFEFRLNKDYGYEWVLWWANGAWQSQHLTTVGDEKAFNYTTPTTISLEGRLMIFATSNDPNAPNAVAWYYPESTYNAHCTLEKSRTNKSVVTQKDRRYRVDIIADWNKTNWCRMNLYVFNQGLFAPQNDNPHTYESFQMEAYQLLGTPNQILAEVQNAVLPIEILDFQGVAKEESNFLTWEIRDTEGGVNIELEKLENGKDVINHVSMSKNDDFYLDKNPFPITYYRLKIKDLGGKITYSKIISLQQKGSKTIKIYPNPVSDILNIDYCRDEACLVSTDTDTGTGIEIVNILGQTVLQFQQLNGNTINVSTLENGVYFLKIDGNVFRFLKEK